MNGLLEKPMTISGQLFAILVVVAVSFGTAYLWGGHWCTLVGLAVGALAAKHKFSLFDSIYPSVAVLVGVVFGSKVIGAAPHYWAGTTLILTGLAGPVGVIMYLLVQWWRQLRADMAEEQRRRDDYE